MTTEEKPKGKDVAAPEPPTTQGRLFDWNKPEQVPPTWNFKENPIIEGVIKKMGLVTLQTHEASYLNVQTGGKDGKIYTVWMSTVIERAIQEKEAAVGDMIGIRMLGEERGGSGWKYTNFDVRILKARKEGV